MLDWKLSMQNGCVDDFKVINKNIKKNPWGFLSNYTDPSKTQWGKP